MKTLTNKKKVLNFKDVISINKHSNIYIYFYMQNFNKNRENFFKTSLLKIIHKYKNKFQNI